jgi:hypothetical protein
MANGKLRRTLKVRRNSVINSVIALPHKARLEYNGCSITFAPNPSQTQDYTENATARPTVKSGQDVQEHTEIILFSL